MNFDMYWTEDEGYVVRANGKVWANYLTEDEADTILYALCYGYMLGEEANNGRDRGKD